MVSKKVKPVFIIAVIGFLGLLVINAINRDILCEGKDIGDLRNRVVGARLIADGKLPYFYHWTPADSTRYYDPFGYKATTVSNITASPFFHQLLIPICFFEQKTIVDIWLFVEYLMYFLIVLIALSAAKNDVSKLLVLVSATAFLYTAAWIHHVFNGQLYMTIPFFIATLFWIHSRAESRFRYILMGIVCTILVLIRPNALIFFLPLLLCFRFLTLKPIVHFFIPPLIAVLLILVIPFQRELWVNYFNAMKEHTVLHQSKQPEQVVASDAELPYTEWEGVVMNNTVTDKESLKNFTASENGNFFVLVNKTFHIQIGVTGLMILSISLILILTLIFYKYLKNAKTINYYLPSVYLFSFCLYMINDLFSPVHRHQYYTVQWLFVILLFFSQVMFSKDRLWMALIAAGVLLNITNTSLIKMEHTIGEYLILCTLLVFSLVSLKRIELEDN